MFPDELDVRLLHELKIDSRRSVRQLAKSLGESPSTIYNRVKRLEGKEVIKRWTVSLDYSLLDLDTTSFVFIQLNPALTNAEIDHRKIANQISKIAGVYEVHLISGDYDILVKLRTNTVKSVGRLILDKIRTIPGVTKTVTNTCFETVLSEGDITPQI